MAAEMHSSFTALRRKHSMNVRQVFEAKRPDDDVLGDLQRIMQIWAEARARFGGGGDFLFGDFGAADRSEEHTSELQSLMRISYAVFCLKKKKNKTSYMFQQCYITLTESCKMLSY